MTGRALHLLLAERVRRAWAARPALAPFPPDLPEFVNAFRQGALGPDFGYAPGGFALLSDLAHLLRSGSVAVALLASARTPTERAFASGWTLHLLAERRFRALIGSAVAELRSGDPSGFIAPADDPLGHARVELGLELWVARAHPSAGRLPMTPVFDELSVKFLRAAYLEAYGIDFGSAPFLASHRALSRLAATEARAVAPVREAAGPHLRPAHEANVTHPPAWLRMEWTALCGGFPILMEDMARDPVRALPDICLQTGRPDGHGEPYSPRSRVLAALRALSASPRNRMPERRRLPDSTEAAT